MRPVEKGIAPHAYTNYGDARHDLAGRIGYYCSYCEMKVRNMIEIEHILSLYQGGQLLSWTNFLLSCKYCNTVKGNSNNNLTNCLWPDRDNTDLAFFYQEAAAVTANSNIPPNIQQLANNSIDLMGLDRYPGGTSKPTEADTRWISRKEAWDLACKSYTDWQKAPIPPMARSIARSSLNGHYGIWVQVFEEEPEVLQEIDEIYREKGLYKEVNESGARIIRQGGQL